MKLYLTQQGDTKRFVGGGIIDDCAVDIAHDVAPGQTFCGLGYDDLKSGTYELNPETDTLTRTGD